MVWALYRIGPMGEQLDYPLKDAATLLALARTDVGLSPRGLAERAGVDESVIADIESGASAGRVDRDVLADLLIAAELRPAVPLGFYASKLRELAGKLGIESVKVFGSTVHGLDTSTSDIDFLVSLSNNASSFALAGFQIEAAKLLKFPVDVMLEETDSPIAERARAEAVPL